MNRRQLLALGAATIAAPQARRVFAQTAPAKVVPDIETRSLDELHKAALAEGGDLMKTYEKFPHGMCTTHADVVNPDLLAFTRS